MKALDELLVKARAIEDRQEGCSYHEYQSDGPSKITSLVAGLVPDSIGMVPVTYPNNEPRSYVCVNCGKRVGYADLPLKHEAPNPRLMP